MGIRCFKGSLHINILNMYSGSGLLVPDIIKVCHEDIDDSALIVEDFNLHHELWGSQVSSPASESFVQWLYDSPFCLINSSVPTHVASVSVCSLIDLSLCSFDFFASTSFQIEDDTYDSDHFLNHIQVDIRPPLQPGIILYKWPLISLEHILFSGTKYRQHRELSWNILILNSNCFLSFENFLNRFSSSSDFRVSTLINL